MRRFITSGFQCAVRNVISFSRQQIRSVMAAAGSSSETDIQDDSEKEDTGDVHQAPAAEEAESDTEVSNGRSVAVSLSKTSHDGSDVSDSGSLNERQENSSSRTSALGHEKCYSLHGMLFARDQPKRLFHVSLWNSSEKGYRTREQVIRDTKGNQNKRFDFYRAAWNADAVLR